MHLYADLNSNMDIVLARMRGFHNVTPVLGGLKSKYSAGYGDTAGNKRSYLTK